MAFASFPAVGSVYENVTVCPAVIAGEVVSTTVESAMVSAVGVRELPFTSREKDPAEGAVADRTSEKPTMTCVPAEFTAAAENVGAVVSAPKLTPTAETFTGALKVDVLPAPNCPLPPLPQHFTPPEFINAQVKFKPVAIADTPVNGTLELVDSRTSTGVDLLVVEPSPT
jgi:hypothetical protein